jgi:gas vesicle protein
MGNGNGGGGGFLPGLIIGAIVGGAAAILLTQEETRDLLVGKAREAGNIAMDATGDLRGKVNDVTNSWQSNASELYERGKQVVDNARTNIDAAVDTGIDAAEALRQELQRNAEG